MSALAQIDVNSFKERVKDHVINTFGALIPPEQFEGMVNAEIHAFFNSTQEMTITTVQSSGYGGRSEAMKTGVTPFRAVVWATLLTMVGPQLDKFFKSEHSPVEKMLKELIEMPEMQEHQSSQAQKLMMGMAAMMFQNVMRAANFNATASIANALRNQHQHDLACIIQNAQGFDTPAPEVT